MKSSAHLFAAALACCASSLLFGCQSDSYLDHVPPEQHAIATEIRDLKGLFDKTPGVGIILVNMQTIKKADDAFIGRLADAVPNLDTLMLDDSGITDACVPHLKRFKSLKSLSIGSTKFQSKTDVQEGDDGRKVAVQTEVAVPLLSPKAVEAIRKQFPEIEIGGVEEPPAT